MGIYDWLGVSDYYWAVYLSPEKSLDKLSAPVKELHVSVMSLYVKFHDLKKKPSQVLLHSPETSVQNCILF